MARAPQLTAARKSRSHTARLLYWDAWTSNRRDRPRRYADRERGEYVERVIPSGNATEREMLEAWIDFHRATLSMKCEGLSREDLRRCAVEPSTLSLLGLVR